MKHIKKIKPKGPLLKMAKAHPRKFTTPDDCKAVRKLIEKLFTP